MTSPTQRDVRLTPVSPLATTSQRESPTTNFSFADSLWLAIVTLTTLGYGDLTPKTAVGRVGSFFSCLMGDA